MMQISLIAARQATTEAVSVSSTSAATTKPLQGAYTVVTPTVDCFMTTGTSPTAVAPSAGVQGGVPLLAGMQYRIGGLQPDERLAFICAAGGSGTVYVTPGA